MIYYEKNEIYKSDYKVLIFVNHFLSNFYHDTYKCNIYLFPSLSLSPGRLIEVMKNKKDAIKIKLCRVASSFLLSLRHIIIIYLINSVKKQKFC